jgi:aminoglycoside phosphotransferase (APT) family kinase protein
LDGPVLTAKVAQAVLRPAFPSVVIDRVLPRTGGENSAVYEVHTREPATRMIIKLYSEELHWKLRKEVYVYGLLGEGLPLPRVLHVDESRGIVDRSAIVLSLLAGAPLSTVGDQLDEGDVSRIYRRLGEVLASIHRIAQPGFGYIGTELLDPLPTNAEYMAARFAHKLAEFANLGGDPAIHEAVSRYVAAHAGMFADCRGAVLCHNDFHEGNVLVDRGERGWEVTGIIDMENAVAADPVLDLAKTEYYSIRGNQTKLEGLRDGYGALPAGYPAAVGVYRVYHALELWDWFASIGKREHLAGLADDLSAFTA